MTRTAFLYFRQSAADGLKRRVFVQGEQQSVQRLRDAGSHLRPRTSEGAETEAQLCAQRGWLFDRIRGVDGVAGVNPLDSGSDSVDFDVYRYDTGDWPTIMSGISDAIANVLGKGAIISTLENPIE